MSDHPASPAEQKLKWRLAVEFFNGQIIRGVDATEILEAWGMMLGWATGKPLTITETRHRVASFATGFYGATLPPRLDKVDDLAFLRTLHAAKAVFLIER